jgi:basic membrane protein A and related proteins
VSAGRLIAILIVMNVILIAGGALFAPEPPKKAGKGIGVGLVFDIGGKNDKSFNEAAWRGLQRAEEELGVDIDYVEPSEGADRETALRDFATHGKKIVIAVGYIFSRNVERLAVDFPNVKFACIDYNPSEGVGTIPNLAGLKFREHEGSFLVGAIAGLMTRTKTVGFVGGMRIPLIRKFEAGYTAGVKHVCPDCEVISMYAGSEPKAFADPPLGQSLASAQYDRGADLIFHASGKTGDGVFAAAKQRGQRAIGVDSDQFSRAPCCIVTSMLKRTDLAVVSIIKDTIAGNFRGGIHELGLADDGVAFVADEHNKSMLPDDVANRARKLREQIIAGTIQVPDH